MSTGTLANSICGLIGKNSGNDSAKQSSLKLQSLLNTAAERIESMKQTHGDDFDKKISLQDSLLLHYSIVHKIVHLNWKLLVREIFMYFEVIWIVTLVQFVLTV